MLKSLVSAISGMVLLSVSVWAVAAAPETSKASAAMTTEAARSATPAAAPTPVTAAPVSVSPSPKVNLNTADANALSDGLSGIGPAKAAAIVEYRKLHGSFKSVDELLEVKGIGVATLEKNRARLTLE